MYVEHPFRLTDADLSRLLSLTTKLDITPGPGGSRCTDFTQTVAVYRSELTDVPFNVEWQQAMVVALYPSAQLVGHCDPPISGKRFHIPLCTNDGCWVHHAGVWRQLKAGHLYEMDPAEFHGAVNWGHTIRLHLVIDVVV